MQVLKGLNGSMVEKLWNGKSEEGTVINHIRAHFTNPRSQKQSRSEQYMLLSRGQKPSTPKGETLHCKQVLLVLYILFEEMSSPIRRQLIHLKRHSSISWDSLISGHSWSTCSLSSYFLSHPPHTFCLLSLLDSSTSRRKNSQQTTITY